MSRHVRCLMLALALPSLAVAEPFVTMLPTGDIIGDGATPVTVHLLALDDARQPISKLEMTPKVWGGDLVSVTEVRPGLYATTITPDNIAEPGVLRVQFKGVNEAKQKIKAQGTVAMRPARRGGIAMAASPERMVLGRDSQATLNLELSGAVRDLTAADLLVTSEHGEVTNVTVLGDGRITAKFIAENRTTPTHAHVGVADRRAPERVYASLIVPLAAMVKQSVKAAPGASVLLRVGGRDFGPVVADARGNATVPIELEPGVNEATLIEVVDGRTEERTIAVGPDSAGVTHVLPGPGLLTVPADSSLSIPVRVRVLEPTGAGMAGAPLKVSAADGVVSEPRHEGDGFYLVTFQPPVRNVPGTVALSFTLGDEKPVVVEIPVSPVRPETIELSGAARGETIELEVQVTGPEGVKLSGRALDVNVTGAKLIGEPSDRRDGSYTVKAKPRAKDVDFVVRASTPGTSNPLRSLVMFSDTERLGADGLSSAMITVLTLDRYGYPVSGVPVEFAMVTGTGSLPGTALTDASGVAQVYYTASRDEGLVDIRARVAGDEAAVGILQGDFPFDELPTSGTPDELALEKRWLGLVGSTRVTP